MATPPYQYPGGPQPYGWGPREHPQGVTVLILGVLSLAVCGLLGPVAWSMGHSALREIDANPAAYTNRGSVMAGYVCGIIASCVLALGLIVFVFVLIAAGASSA